MNGIHDMGGMHGFGEVPYERDPEPFKNDMERRSFALTNLLLGYVGNVDRFRHTIEKLPISTYLEGYYERWLATTERLAAEEGFVTRKELLERCRTLARGEAAAPAEPIEVSAARGEGTTKRSVESAPRFGEGDAVLTNNDHPQGHTRLPRYARGKRGIIARVHPSFVFPDTNADGEGENPQYVYAVSFRGEDLWGEDAESGTKVQIDLFESYLRPA
ncbi:MAG: nitrile hydratase subunit beta [Acidobacteriota bacterium]